VAGSCECGDEPSGSCATELVSQSKICTVVKTMATPLFGVKNLTIKIYTITILSAVLHGYETEFNLEGL
jgi:hypothetical protein